MSEPGRPTLYRPEYCKLARNYCLLGATNEELGAFFDVTSRTIDNWIATRPEFASAVREAKAMADARVARCLYQRAVGYERTVERIVLHQGREHKLVNKVHLPPDVRACIFWLCNRQPDLWSNRPEAPPEDDGSDFVAALEAASEAARHLPIPSSQSQEYDAPLDAAAQSLASEEPGRASENDDSSPWDDGVALPGAASEVATATPEALPPGRRRRGTPGRASGIPADREMTLASSRLPRAPPR